MNNKVILISFMLIAAVRVAHGEPVNGKDDSWTKNGYFRSGGELRYLGTSNGEASENVALLMAEQDAVTQMIKHYFGVKMKYSLSASESLSSVKLSIDKAESSESIELKGLSRSRVKVEPVGNGTFRAWVQIAVPEKNLREEKLRLERIRAAQNEAARQRQMQKEAKDQKDRVPLLYLGMPRELFISRYPAPNSILGFFPYEVFHYEGWSFCDGGFLGCNIHFSDGKLTSWERINSRFVDFSRSNGP